MPSQTTLDDIAKNPVIAMSCQPVSEKHIGEESSIETGDMSVESEINISDLLLE